MASDLRGIRPGETWSPAAGYSTPHAILQPVNSKIRERKTTLHDGDATWHRSRQYVFPCSPQSVRWASPHFLFPCGWCVCLHHSWTPPQSWVDWHPSLSRTEYCHMTAKSRENHPSGVKMLSISKRMAMASSPISGVEGDGAWVLHFPSQQGGPHASIQFGHLYLVQVAFHPVDVSCYPVHGQALWSGQAILDHHLETGQS